MFLWDVCHEKVDQHAQHDQLTAQLRVFGPRDVDLVVVNAVVCRTILLS